MLDTSMGQRAQTDRGLQVAQGSVFITLKSQCPTTRQSSFEMSARQNSSTRTSKGGRGARLFRILTPPRIFGSRSGVTGTTLVESRRTDA